MQWIDTMGWTNYLSQQLHEGSDYDKGSNIQKNYATKMNLLPRSYDTKVGKIADTWEGDHYYANNLGWVTMAQAADELTFGDKLRSIPAWVNKGEAAIPDWMTWATPETRALEDNSITMINSYISEFNKGGITAEELISRAGAVVKQESTNSAAAVAAAVAASAAAATDTATYGKVPLANKYFRRLNKSMTVKEWKILSLARRKERGRKHKQDVLRIIAERKIPRITRTVAVRCTATIL
jgi:hypothetical protein